MAQHFTNDTAVGVSMRSRKSIKLGKLSLWTVSGVVLSVLALSSAGIASAASVPPGFTDSLVVAGLTNPTAMALAPDGRVFVCEQGGNLRVIKNGTLLATPFLTVTVDSSGERGLLGVAFDPNFVSNQLVYVYYTATTPTTHNRISRFTASGDVAMAGSETVVMDLNNLSPATTAAQFILDLTAICMLRLGTTPTVPTLSHYQLDQMARLLEEKQA